MEFFIQAGSLVTTVCVKVITPGEAVSLAVDFYFFLKWEVKEKILFDRPGSFQDAPGDVLVDNPSVQGGNHSPEWLIRFISILAYNTEC